MDPVPEVLAREHAAAYAMAASLWRGLRLRGAFGTPHWQQTLDALEVAARGRLAGLDDVFANAADQLVSETAAAALRDLYVARVPGVQ